MHLVDGLTEAFPLSDRRHVAVFTRSDMVELWSTRPGKPAKREAGPFGPLNPDLDLVGDIGSSGFFLATGSSVRFLKADDPGYLQRYEFAENQRFLAATKDGKAVLLSPVPGGVLRLVRFDPALWRRHLCTVLGRGLTDDERGSLPGDLPTEICPP